ncbi:MAG: septum formation initiator family protein [Bacteroidales bacterium]|nr:septum formation initiator family protein [Bacteroidales bacterium]
MDWNRIKKVVLNKYFIATVVFLVVIAFVDEYSLRVSARLHRQVDALHAEEQALKDAIVADSAANAELKSSLDAKEHYGRENYYMKRPDEDIFVIK